MGTVGECFRASPNADTEKVGYCYNNLVFTGNTLSKCYSFCLFGTYTGIANGKSLSQNIEFSNNIIRDSISNQVFFIAKSFGLKIFGNSVLNTGNAQSDTDFSHDAVFFLDQCDGEMHDNIITGHRGNGFRIYGCGPKAGVAGNVLLHDNYIHDSRAHSPFETNGNTLPAGFFANIVIKNNTAGNLAAGAYHSAVLSAYPQPTGSKVYFENNVGFNTNFNETDQPPAATTMHMIFTDTGTKPDTNLNNFYYPTAEAAGVDLATGKLLATAPQYGKAGAWPAAPVPPVTGKKKVASVFVGTKTVNVFDDTSSEIV